LEIHWDKRSGLARPGCVPHERHRSDHKRRCCRWRITSQSCDPAWMKAPEHLRVKAPITERLRGDPPTSPLQPRIAGIAPQSATKRTENLHEHSPVSISNRHPLHISVRAPVRVGSFGPKAPEAPMTSCSESLNQTTKQHAAHRPNRLVPKIATEGGAPVEAIRPMTSSRVAEAKRVLPWPSKTPRNASYKTVWEPAMTFAPRCSATFGPNARSKSMAHQQTPLIGCCGFCRPKLAKKWPALLKFPAETWFEDNSSSSTCVRYS